MNKSPDASLLEKAENWSLKLIRPLKAIVLEKGDVAVLSEALQRMCLHSTSSESNDHVALDDLVLIMTCAICSAMTIIKQPLRPCTQSCKLSSNFALHDVSGGMWNISFPCSSTSIARQSI